MNSWQNSIRNEKKLTSRTDLVLRHNFDRVFVSSLASQLYCEIKLDFDIKTQPEPTSEQKHGTEIHDALIPVELVTPEELINNIESRS